MASKKSPAASKTKVSFTTLRTERGTARAVPGLVRDLGDAAQSPGAIRKLEDLLIPFDRVNEATGPALGLVIEALKSPLPSRGDVGTLALHLAEIDRPEALFALGMDPSQPALARYAEGHGASIRDAIAEALDALLALAADGDPQARLVGLRLLGYARPHAVAASARIVERLGIETDVRVIPWSMVAGHQLALAIEDRSPVQRAIEDAAARVSNPVVRGLANLVLASLAGQSDRLEVALLAGALKAPLEPWKTADRLRPWHTASVDGALLAILGSGPLGAGGRLAGARAVIQVGRELGNGIGGLWRSDMADAWVSRVLRWFFRAGPTGHKTLYEAPIAAADLDPIQREVLAGISSFENHQLGSEYMNYGLPQDRRSRLRLVGEMPPSVLECEVVPGRPLWQFVLDGYANHKEQRPFLEHLSPALASLTTADQLDLWTELLSGAYVRQTFKQRFGGSDVLERAIAQASRDEIFAWADRHLTSRGVGYRDLVEGVGYEIVGGVVEKLGDGELLPERFDPLLTMFGGRDRLRKIFSRLSSERAARIFDRALHASSMGVGTSCERAATLADIHPMLATQVLDFYAGQSLQPIGSVRDALDEARAKSVELDQLLRARNL